MILMYLNRIYLVIGIIVLTVLFAPAAAAQSQPSVVYLPIIFSPPDFLEISEIMASNGSTLLDEDGDSSDWIEIHKNGASGTNLSGYYLTDDSADLTKWQFPNVGIAPQGHLLVFASNKNRTTVGAPLHTNFKLSSNGEYLALVEPDGVTIAWQFSPAYPKQYRDVSYGLPQGSTQYRYFQSPTPRVANVANGADLGPIIADLIHSPSTLYSGTDLSVVAQILSNGTPISSVKLVYRVGFNSEQTLTMTDNGSSNDGAAGDNIYGVAIPASAFSTGDMVRYYVKTTDSSGNESRWPLFTDEDGSAEYLGTVVEDASVSDPLPIIHLHIEDWDSAESRDGTRGSVYYDGHLYDNIFIRKRGLISATYPKKSFKLEFNRGDYFTYNAANPPVREFNLNTTWGDYSFMRQTLAWSAYAATDMPSSLAFPMRVHGNGSFHSIATFVEQIDDIYLERNGLDPDGALYKFRCCTTLHSATEAVEKKNRTHEDNQDLEAAIAGLSLTGGARTTYFLDNFDVQSVVNYLATTVVIQDYDYIENNYYLYRDSDDSGEWYMLPWDKDKAFGAVSEADHPVQGHPFYGSFDYPYPVVPFRIGHNQLMEAVYTDPLMRELYLRRLRTVMDEVLSHPSTPYSDRFFEQTIDTLTAQMIQSVNLDRADWAPFSPSLSFGTNEIVTHLIERRTHLFGTLGPGDQNLIPAAQPATFNIQFGTLETNPASGDQDEEYFTLYNPNTFALDISGYMIANDIDYVFAGGTVIPAQGTLYVSPDAKTFRARATSPKGAENLLLVGDYSRHLNNVGGILELLNPDGILVNFTIHGTPP